MKLKKKVKNLKAELKAIKNILKQNNLLPIENDYIKGTNTNRPSKGMIAN